MFYNPAVEPNTFPILEVGPGALPFPLSDIWLDIKFSDAEHFAQSGRSQPATGRPVIYYDGGKFPFKDKAFKYVIASHVLEHVPWEKVPLFITELQRVASAGYIELPRWTWELVNNIPEHLLAGDVINNKLHLYRKNNRPDYNLFSSILIEKSPIFREYIAKEKELYFCRLEWAQTISCEIHETGYPLDKEIPEIIDILKKDCERLISLPKPAEAFPWTALPPQARGFLRRTWRRLKSKSSAPAQLQPERPSLNKNEISELLQCPLCAQTIGPDHKCQNCHFSFDINGKEYYPRY
jgi:hypothetical protein